VRIATWNINGLQELKLTDEQFPHADFEAEGYRAATHGQKAWNGVAIVTREEARVTQVGLPGQEEFGARLLSADVGGLSFTTVYVPNGKTLEHDDYPRKLAWLDALAGHFREHHPAASPTVLCGDFNVVPTALDSWSEERHAGQIFHTDEERARYRAFHEMGLSDIFRERFPEEQAFSWWDYRGGAFHRRQGLRIDFLLASESVMKRVRSVEIDRDWRKKREGLTASDHAPVVADLE
jgi:exodeoxyribonuclease-3